MSTVITAVDGTKYELLTKKDMLGRTVPFSLGKGGQGIAYKVKSLSTGGQLVAKYYHERTPKEFNDNLEQIIAMPSPHEAFVWPQKLLSPKKNGAIGYIMELYDNQVYKKFSDVAIYGKAQFKSRTVQLNALIELVSAFEALHANGRCFMDINEGGVVIDVERGRVRICDCENVTPAGMRVPVKFGPNGEKLYMQGFPRYKAPEVEIRAMLPDKYTDRYSLAVMIFMLLTRCHPLEGQKRFKSNPEGIVDANVTREIYGTNPIFIYDDNNKTNRPDPKEDAGAIIAWPSLPPFIKDLFKQAFCQGLPVNGVYDEKKKAERCNRPTEKQWREAFIKWMDLLVSCNNCNFSFVADVDVQKGTMKTVCPKCKCNNRHEYPIMKVYKRKALKRAIILVPGKEIPISAVSDAQEADTAVRVMRAKKPGIHAIKNTTQNNWSCYYGQASATLKAGEFVQIQDTMRVAFNFDYYGEIVIAPQSKPKK